MPNPRPVPDWAKRRGRRAKTDAHDALLLAQYGAEQPQRQWQPLPGPVRERESLLLRKEDLGQLLPQERNRQGGLVGRPGVAEAVGRSITPVIDERDKQV